MFVRPHINSDKLHQYIWLANTKLWQLVPLMNKFCSNFEKKKEKIDQKCGFSAMFVKPCIFSNKANHQSIHENFYVLHQYFWLENTELLQLAPLRNKFGKNSEKNMKLSRNKRFQGFKSDILRVTSLLGEKFIFSAFLLGQLKFRKF